MRKFMRKLEEAEDEEKFKVDKVEGDNADFLKLEEGN